MLKIFGNSLSGPCNKVRYACNLLGIDYEWISLDFAAGEHKTPENLVRHPAGKLPTIDDDGFTLFESDAICRYLSDKHGGKLVPADLQARALMEQWNAFTIQHVGLAMSKVAFNRYFAPKFGMPVDENSLREGLQWLGRYLPIVNDQLGKGAYLAGDQLTLADISLLTVFDYSDRSDVALDDYDHITRWRKAPTAEDWYTAAHA